MVDDLRASGLSPLARLYFWLFCRWPGARLRGGVAHGPHGEGLCATAEGVEAAAAATTAASPAGAEERHGV